MTRRIRMFLPLVLLAIPAIVVGADVASAGRPTCFGRPATHVGDGGRDVIDGTSGPDVIVTRGGNDDIDGAGGRDRICAGG